jgi:hypothetical protein
MPRYASRLGVGREKGRGKGKNGNATGQSGKTVVGDFRDERDGVLSLRTTHWKWRQAKKVNGDSDSDSHTMTRIRQAFYLTMNGKRRSTRAHYTEMWYRCMQDSLLMENREHQCDPQCTGKHT